MGLGGLGGVGTAQLDKDSLNNNTNNINNNSVSQNNKAQKEVHSPTSTVSYLSSPSTDSVGSLIKIKLKADAQGRSVSDAGLNRVKFSDEFWLEVKRLRSLARSPARLINNIFNNPLFGDSRFGFNVKGGLDQNNSPIVVSKVVPNTPADSTAPRLKEGDEVVAINGHEVRGLTHEQVVKLIRSWVEDANSSSLPGGGRSGTSPNGTSPLTAADSESFGSVERPQRKKDKKSSGVLGEIVLTVRPQAFLFRKGADTDLESEPDFQYIPLSSDDLESPRVASAASKPLQESMLLLKENLHSGALVAQFEQLYRKKPGMFCEISKLAKNAALNRYKDISPCELTYPDHIRYGVEKIRGIAIKFSISNEGNGERLLKHRLYPFPDDKTRVVLTTDSPNGNDYINASYVIVSVGRSENGRSSIAVTFGREC